MHKIACRFGPATRVPTNFHQSSHHVNIFRNRATFRCIHSGSDRVAGGAISGDGALKEKTETGADGINGEISTAQKDQEKVQPQQQDASSSATDADPLQKVEQTGSSETPPNVASEQGPVTIRKVGTRTIHAREMARIQQRVRKGEVEWSDVIQPLPKPTKREAAIKADRFRRFQEKTTSSIQIMNRSCTLECDFPDQAVS